MKKIAAFFLLFFLIHTLSAQEKYTVSGYVKESGSGEYLIGANVYVKEILKGTTTNQYGFYSLTLEKGTYHIGISFLGFMDTVYAVFLDKNIRLNADLMSKSMMAKEVLIEAERADKNLKGTEMGTTEISIETIKSIPAFMGEVDILKTIQLLPGVQSAGEGNAGYYVRGGGPDQNLILLDESVVYNASHLFGFFSVFNADAVKNVTLIKGGMPASYGGRLASVLDVSMKEGNNRSYHAEGGIGLISSRLTVQGPLKKDTSSFIISARRTYADILTKTAQLFSSQKSEFEGSGYFFYDLNTKINYRISDKDRLLLSGYFGRDVFSFKNKGSDFGVSIPWGNATTTLRWNHLFNDKLFMNAMALFSDYKFEMKALQDKFEFRLYSGIRDWNAKVDFSYYPNVKHSIRYGVNYIFHTFTPSSISARSGEVELAPEKIIRQYANEGALYFSDDIDISDRFKLNAGIRYSAFQHTGPYDRFVTDSLTGRITDTIHYDPFRNIKTYHGPEPRISLRYAVDEFSSVKASFTMNNQYMHLASMSSITLPTDIWVPSSLLIKPQVGKQYAIGYFRNFSKDIYETSAEVYYKDMKNLIDYKEGSLPEDNINNNIDNSFTFGKGWSYGLELFLKKRTGKLNGWIGYTLSWTKRKFPEINLGEEYYARYDRRHDLSAIATYDLNAHWSFSSVFVYGTGNAITLPVARYFINGEIHTEWGGRNWFRMDPYHRMDVSITYTGKKHLRYESSWNLSVYNVYNRHNPYFIYFENTGNLEKGTLDLKAKQVSLFPVIPSVTWNFKF